VGGEAKVTPDPFTATDRALGELRLEWGDQYAVCYDGAAGIEGGRWRAWRHDKVGGMLAGKTPQELRDAIRADRGARNGARRAR
jgi:hypothetical protein